MTDESTTPAPEENLPAEIPAEAVEATPEPAPLPVPSAGEVDYEPLAGGTVADVNLSDLDMVLDVPVELSVEIGRTIMTIRETLEIGPGAIITLNKMTGEPVDLLVNGRRIARGEVVAIDEEFGLRVTQVITPDQRGEAA
jgi:flagellar motor switch protein FliN/FliY